MYFEEPVDETTVSMSPAITAALALAMVGMIGMAIFPSFILNFAGNALIGF
jgi:hypothetical protein